MNRRAALSLFAAAPAAAALASCRGDPAARLFNKPMPSRAAMSLSGTAIDLSRLGKPAVIRVWGLWCPPCTADEPFWEEAVGLVLGDRDLRRVAVLSVHTGEAPANGPTLAAWAAARRPDVAVPVVDDRDGALVEAIGVPGTPSILLVDAGGVIREHNWALKSDRGVRAFHRKVRHLFGRER